MITSIPTIPLTPKISLPLVGLGTWDLTGSLCTQVVRMAIEMGYSHIDTAHLYGNHKEIGKAIVSFPRDQLFLTSKFIFSQLGRFSLEETLDLALKDLKTDYLDLYLMHAPDRNSVMKETLLNLEKLKETGKVRLVGVSNCTIRHLTDMMQWGFHPTVNQIEFHPNLYQKELLDFCNQHRIVLESYSTLGKGAFVNDPLFSRIASHYGKSASQVLLRWCVEKKIPVIPKASSRKHLEENLNIFDFSLSKEDVQILDSKF